jgi:hypothetical protein
MLHPNGTLYLFCDSSVLFRSESIAGPWAHVWTWSPESAGGPVGGYEDGFLWLDRRGAWHALFHVWDTHSLVNQTHCVTSTVSAHGFSADGLSWHVGSEQPYNTTVAFAGGGRPSEISPTRERPKLLFAADGVTPLFLFNGAVTGWQGGACAEPWCSSCKRLSKSYTLVVPLGQAGEEAAARAGRGGGGWEGGAAGSAAAAGGPLLTEKRRALL